MIKIKKKKGFTLIEVLVVVLIIGILAAIALPQYKKVVEKSRTMQALPILRSTGESQEVFLLLNNSYASSFDELGADIPWTGNTKWILSPFFREARSNNDWSLQILIDEESGNKGFFAARLTGRFEKRAGIVWLSQYEENHAVPLRTPLCWESSSLEKGIYCEQILKGTLVHRTGLFRYYTL